MVFSISIESLYRTICQIQPEAAKETEIIIQLTKYKGYSILYLLKSKLTSEILALLTLLLSYYNVLRLSNGTIQFNSGNALNR